jgi:formylglycine-generating enzyme
MSKCLRTRVLRRLALIATIATMAASVAVALVFRGGYAEGAKPQDVSAASNAQVAGALVALSPVLSRPGRRVAAGSRGTLEAAIRAYAPSHPWPVEEGAIAAPARLESRLRCPPEMALILRRFCVDRFEGALDEWDAGVRKPHSPYGVLSAGIRYVAVSVEGQAPQGYISAIEAAAACHEAGKRLCAPAEWRAACGGSQGLAYPYGVKRERGRCNDSARSPMMMYYAPKMESGFDVLSLNDPKLNQVAGTLARAGEFSGCVTDEGVHDMVGNLHEWTSDPNGTFQGGYYLDTAQHGEGCAYRTIAHGPSYHDYSTGFRCCMDAPVVAVAAP